MNKEKFNDLVAKVEFLSTKKVNQNNPKLN